MDAILDISHINGIIYKFAFGDVEAQLSSLKDFPSIASSLGAQKTRELLIPVLQVKCIENKEVVQQLAELLPKFISFVGGPEKFHHLLPIFEIVLHFNENEFQEVGAECLKSLSKKLGGVHVEQQVLPFVERLSKDSWSTKRATSCGLYSVCYSLISDLAKKQMLRDFRQLCEDDDLSVRLAAVSKLGDFAKCVEFKFLESDFVPAFVQLQEDAEDSVRTRLVDAFFGISAKFIPRNVEQLLMPTMRKLFADKSYTVRHKVAEKITELQKAVGAGITKTDLVPILSALLKDPKAEVRAMAMLRINDFCKNLDKIIRESFLKNEVLPQLKPLAGDTCLQVRLAACELPHIGAYLDANTIKEHLMPVVATLIEDGSPSVSSRVISNLGSLKNVIGVQMVAEFLFPVFEKLQNDHNLTVRLTFIENLPILAKQLGSEILDKRLTTMCISKTTDNCFITREFASSTLKHLSKILGSEWVKNDVMPFVLNLFQGNRDVILYERSLALIKVLVDACETPGIFEQFLPVVFRLAEDQTSSVRSLVSETLNNLTFKLLQSSEPHMNVLTDIKSVLVGLSKDQNTYIKQLSLRSLDTFFPSDESLDEAAENKNKHG